MELFQKKKSAHSQNTPGNMRMPSDLQLVYMIPRNSMQLLNINNTKFQVEREPVYYLTACISLKIFHYGYPSSRNVLLQADIGHALTKQSRLV